MFSFAICSTAVILHLVKFSSGEVPDTSFNLERHVNVTDVVPKPPRNPMRVSYNNSHVELGNVLSPSQVRSEPTVHWDTEAGAFYSLGMVDPDAPDPRNPTLGEMLHWLIVNIPGAQSTEQPVVDIRQGEVKAEYIGSGPPNGTGFHRYIFLAYKQSTKLTFQEEYVSASSRKGRMKFKIRKFAEKYNLSHPVAGNVFRSQFDGSVPTRHTVH